MKCALCGKPVESNDQPEKEALCNACAAQFDARLVDFVNKAAAGGSIHASLHTETPDQTDPQATHLYTDYASGALTEADLDKDD
jgi:hypothetical protein